MNITLRSSTNLFSKFIINYKNTTSSNTLRSCHNISRYLVNQSRFYSSTSTTVASQSNSNISASSSSSTTNSPSSSSSSNSQSKSNNQNGNSGSNSHVNQNSILLSTIPKRINYQILRENNNPNHINHQEGSRTRFKWDGEPKTVLIVKKHKDKRITLWLNTIASWLKQTYNIRVLIEPNVATELTHIETYTEEESHLLGKVVDFVITLGGDGTLLHVSSLFKEDVPPIISFHLGTLGFLMPFNVEDYQEALDNVIKGDFLCTNRMRLMCDVFHKQQLGTNTPSRSFQVLNEVTIHRGSNPHSTVINCTINGHMLTDIIGDGLIVATATGSTAYSLSCGGPMVHPCINCILITPIAPSSLSSKPALLPDDSVLKLNISQKGKSFTTTFDGTRSIKMEQGEHIIIRKSHYPLLTINKTNETTDWVHGNGKLIEMSDRSGIWKASHHLRND